MNEVEGRLASRSNISLMSVWEGWNVNSIKVASPTIYIIIQYFFLLVLKIISINSKFLRPIIMYYIISSDNQRQLQD